MYGVSYGRLPLFKVCGGASPSCRRNPLALARGGSQDLEKELHKLLAEYKYIPESKFHGSAMECFAIMTNEALLILDELTKS